jgi:hypothetical protein
MKTYIVSYKCKLEYSIYHTTGKAFVSAVSYGHAVRRAMQMNSRITEIISVKRED